MRRSSTQVLHGCSTCSIALVASPVVSSTSTHHTKPYIRDTSHMCIRNFPKHLLRLNTYTAHYKFYSSSAAWHCLYASSYIIEFAMHMLLKTCVILANFKLLPVSGLFLLIAYSGNLTLLLLFLEHIQLYSWIFTDMPTIIQAYNCAHYQLQRIPTAYNLFAK